MLIFVRLDYKATQALVWVGTTHKNIGTNGATSPPPYQMAVQWMSSLTAETWVVLLILNIFLLIAGCFLDPTPLLLITAPVIIPILHNFHINVIHFGVVMVLNVLIGLLTPPVGLALYVVIDIAKISFSDVCKAIWPFYIPLIIVLLLIPTFRN